MVFSQMTVGKQYVVPALRIIARVAHEPFCASGEGTTDNYDEITADWE